MGVTDPNRKYDMRDLARGDVIVAATGVTDGGLIKGVKFGGNVIATEYRLPVGRRNRSPHLLASTANCRNSIWTRLISASLAPQREQAGASTAEDLSEGIPDSRKIDQGDPWNLVSIPSPTSHPRMPPPVPPVSDACANSSGDRARRPGRARLSTGWANITGPTTSPSAPADDPRGRCRADETIRLTSAVTVLSSEDPDPRLSAIRDPRPDLQWPCRDHGRAGLVHRELPAFRLRPQRLRRAVRPRSCSCSCVRKGGEVSWPGGRHTPAIDNRGIYPRPVQEQLPLWIAVGGTPQSVVRAATLGLPLALAIIGGEPARFAPFFDLYRQSALKAGHNPKGAFQRASTSTALSARHPSRRPTISTLPQAEVMNRHRRGAGLGYRRAGPSSIRLAARTAHSSLATRKRSPTRSSPCTLSFSNDRFLLQMAIGSIAHDKLMQRNRFLSGRRSRPSFVRGSRRKPRRTVPGCPLNRQLWRDRITYRRKFDISTQLLALVHLVGLLSPKPAPRSGSRSSSSPAAFFCVH